MRRGLRRLPIVVVRFGYLIVPRRYGKSGSVRALSISSKSYGKRAVTVMKYDVMEYVYQMSCQ